MKTRRFVLMAGVAICLSVPLGIRWHHREQQLNRIREVVYRHLLSGELPRPNLSTPPLAFLELAKGKDPPPVLLARLASVKYQIRPVSASRTPDVDGIFDKASGQRGILYYIDKVTWTTSSEVQVVCGWWVDGLGASHDIYYLRRENDMWHISSIKNVMIS